MAVVDGCRSMAGGAENNDELNAAQTVTFNGAIQTSE
jgi:hypothetical protein